MADPADPNPVAAPPSHASPSTDAILRAEPPSLSPRPSSSTSCSAAQTASAAIVAPLSSRPQDTDRWSWRNPTLVAALVSGAFGVASVLLSYLLVQRTQTDLQRDSVNIERLKAEIQDRSLSLERSKAEVAAAAQRTADLVAQVEAQRLQLAREAATTTARIEDRRLKLDESKGRTDEVRITLDFTKLLNEIRPAITISCSAGTDHWPLISITCRAKNVGVNKVILRADSVYLLDYDSRAVIPDAFVRATLPSPSAIPAGIDGAAFFEVEVGRETAVRQKATLRILFQTQTDNVSSEMAQRLSKGVLTRADIERVANQGHEYYLAIAR